MLKLIYNDDIFMMYETMNSVLFDLKEIDRDITKLMLEESTLI